MNLNLESLNLEDADDDDQFLEEIISKAQEEKLYYGILNSLHIASNLTTDSNQEVSLINQFKSIIEGYFIGCIANHMENQRQMIHSFEEALLRFGENNDDLDFCKAKQENESLIAELNLKMVVQTKVHEFLNWLNEWEQEVQSNE